MDSSMDSKAARLALARKKLKDHQEKKNATVNQEKVNKLDSSETEVKNNNETKPKSDVLQKQILENISYQPAQDNAEQNVNVTEILVANKTNLEAEIGNLQSQLSQIDLEKQIAVNNLNNAYQQISKLELHLNNINKKLLDATQTLELKNKTLTDLQNEKSSLVEENSNLVEQLDFTKTLLTSKQAENNSLSSQVTNLQNQLEVTQLQLQQVTLGAGPVIAEDLSKNAEIESLLGKISTLEQQAKRLQKERDQINVHYEQYVAELNDQLNALTNKNVELNNEVERLMERENNLVEQIGDMEIRIQNFKIHKHEHTFNNQDAKDNSSEMLEKLNKAQEDLKCLSVKFENLQKLYMEREAQIIELSQKREEEPSYNSHDDISISKLSADIASDKLAAQRATEQNKQLKIDIEKLEEAYVKMSRDKLELTEKLTAEKYLNRELTLKLAEVEEKTKDMHTKLKAKDEEMIRLQGNYKELEKKFETFAEKKVENNNSNDIHSQEKLSANQIEASENDQETQVDVSSKPPGLPSEFAMLKLQDRFLKIMDEVANLSDEKHRLEHIILQLQNETDTICEYVALYQQQRSLLKKKDEERSAQMKIFESECERLKSQLEELSSILVKFAEDKELSQYFQNESKENDITKVMTLLSNLKQSSLVDPVKKKIDFEHFYPCSCCSGQLIEV